MIIPVRRRPAPLLALVLMAGVMVGGQAAAVSPQPNILFVLVDDMGFGDLGANGNSQFATPNMDRLAAEGVRFTRHYTDSTCQPSRLGILSGRYPARAGFRARGRGIPGEWLILPESLQAAGYRTHHIGKWHLGSEPAAVRPLAQGFDHWYGFLEARALRGPGADGEVVYRAPTYHNPWLIEDDGPGVRVPGHLNDIITQRAVDAIRAAPAEPPWFINVWYFAPHRPIQPAKRYLTGEDDAVTRFLALMRQLDDNIGRMLAAVDESGARDRTVVVLASDNGGSEKDLPNNAPFRGAKQSYREGGVRTPLMMRWPGRFEADRVVDQPVSMLDLYPTLAALAGARTPADLDGRSILPLLDGESLPARPLFWELSTGERYQYSVLSADARWRLWRLWDGSPMLFDLVADPYSGRDVQLEHADIVEQLESQYRLWHEAARRIPLTVRPMGTDGKASVTGRALARAPGSGGYTFGIGVHPDTDFATATRRQVLVRQAGIWQVSLGQDGVQVAFPGLTLKGGPLTPGRCHSLIVTGDADQSLLKPAQERRAIFSLYIDGQLQDSNSAVLPDVDQALDAPTLIGFGAKGLDDFQGHLGTPVVLNTRLGEQSQVGLPGVDAFAPTLCAG